MKTKRLLALADFLETVPPERFDMNHWVGHGWEGDPSLSCGTSACALGWAATMPEFRKLGLRIRPATYDAHAAVIEYVYPNGQHPGGYAAAEAFFGLSNDQAYYVFGCGTAEARQRTPHDQAQHIRAFVAKHRREARRKAEWRLPLPGTC